MVKMKLLPNSLEKHLQEQKRFYEIASEVEKEIPKLKLTARPGGTVYIWGLAQHWQEIIDYSQTVVANIVSFLSYWELWKEKNESDDDEDFFYRRPDLATLHVQMYGEASANRIFAYRERLAWLLIYSIRSYGSKQTREKMLMIFLSNGI